MIDNTERHLERSLDFRTLFHLKSIVLALVCVNFDCDEKDSKNHIALQRNGNLMDIDKHTDATEHLIYGSDGKDVKPKNDDSESILVRHAVLMTG